MQGDLAREALGDVIRQLYVNRRSGILHLSREKVSKRIYFRKGSMIFANSDVETDRLGEFLIRHQVIDRDAFSKASSTMKESGNRFGRTLVELGYATADEMEGRVVEQIQTIIYSLFGWSDGEYRFEQHENPVDEDIVLNLSTADIILEGTRRLDDMDKVRRAIGDLARVLRTTEDPLLLYQKMSTLSQSEYFILSRVDGLSSVADILSISPIGEEETLRCVYGLVSAGVIEAVGGEKEPAPVAAESPAPAPRAVPVAPSPPPPPVTVAAPPQVPQVEVPRPEARVEKPAVEVGKPKVEPPTEGPSLEEIAVREDIIEKHASLSEATLYDLLNIKMTANDAEIKKAYYAMAKKYHPDRHHSPHLRDIHGLLEELFGKITDAYQALSSPLEKNRYDAKIRAEGSAAGGGAAEAGPSAEEASEAGRKRAAEERYKEGKRHFDEMHFYDAIQCLKESVRLFSNKKNHKLLAQALMKNPKWMRDAEEHFRAALKMDQFDAECLMGLGDIYNSEGMSTRAQKMYEQAITYDPENEEIRQKLDEKRGEGGGALKRLFGRKKV